MTWDYLWGTRKGLDLFFWVLHFSFALAFSINGIVGSEIYQLILLLTGIIAIVSYIVSLGTFVKQHGRNPVFWCFITLLLSPLSYWATYYLSFKDLDEPLTWVRLLKTVVIVLVIILFIFIVLILPEPVT